QAAVLGSGPPPARTVELPEPVAPQDAKAAGTAGAQGAAPPATPAPAARDSAAPDPRLAPDGTSRLFRGGAIDARGEPLANHLLQLYVSEEGEPPGPLTLEQQTEIGRAA